MEKQLLSGIIVEADKNTGLSNIKVSRFIEGGVF